MRNGRRMRTLISLVVTSSLLAPTAYAQSPLAPAAAPSAMVQVGVAAAVSGMVRVNSGPSVGTLVESGRPIFLGDVITTDAQGRLQVMLLDETVFTVGPSSSVVIDEFVYDPATSDGKVSAQVLKGAFRFVTGKIAHKKPENMKVTLPSGTIGVRGTMVAGRVDGQSSLVALLGPGPNNNAGARIGKIEVSNPVDGQLATVLVTQPGFGTTIPGANLPPTPPAMLPPQVMDALQHDLSGPPAPKAPAPAANETAAGDQSTSTKTQADDEDKPRSTGPQGPHRPDGQKPPRDGSAPNGPPGTNPAAPGPQGPPPPGSTFGTTAGTYSGLMPPPPPPGSTFGTFDPYATANSAYQQTTTAAQTTTTVANGIAYKEQLSQIQTGQFHWQGTGAFVQTRKLGAPVNIPGTMQVKMNIDFGARTIGGGLSHVNVNTTGGGGNIGVSMPVALQSFNSAGPAMFQQNQNNAGSTFRFDYAVQNVNGVIGQGLGVHGHYETTDGLNIGDGAYNLPRQDGPIQ